MRKQLLRGEDIQQASSLFSRTTHSRMEILFDSILTRFLVLLKPNNTIDLLMFHVKQKKPTRDCDGFFVFNFWLLFFYSELNKKT